MVQFSHAGNTEWRTPVLLHRILQRWQTNESHPTSMVGNAMNKDNDIIVRRTGGTKVFQLEWLQKCEEETKCNC